MSYICTVNVYKFTENINHTTMYNLIEVQLKRYLAIYIFVQFTKHLANPVLPKNYLTP